MRAIRPLIFASIMLAAAGCARQPQVAGVTPASSTSRGLGATTPAAAQIARLLTPPSISPSSRLGFLARSRPPAVATAPTPLTPGAPASGPTPMPGPAVMAQDFAPGRASPMAVAPRAYVPAAYAPRMAPVMPAPDPTYRLGPGDKLRVTVFGQEGLSNAYIVDAAGNVALPLIGSVPAAGLSDRELSGAIAERLRDGYIREPHVAVQIEGYRPFFILGEVTAPGQYPYVPNMTAETAVAIAGGFTPRASHQRVLLTRGINGQPVRFAGPFAMPVRPGDTITVEERWF